MLDLNEVITIFFFLIEEVGENFQELMKGKIFDTSEKPKQRKRKNIGVIKI